MANPDPKRPRTFESVKAIAFLDKIEQYVAKNPRCSIGEITLAFHPVTEGTIRAYMVELHAQERVSYEPIKRSGPRNIMEPRKWIVGNSGLRIKRARDPEVLTQVQRKKWPTGKAVADPKTLPVDFFKVATRK